MGFIIACAVLWFVLRRWRRRAWLVQLSAPPQALPWGWGHAPHPHRNARAATFPRSPYAPVAVLDGRVAAQRGAGPVRRESALEALKRRYVAGDLSDEGYERELDELFRTPAGRREL